MNSGKLAQLLLLLSVGGCASPSFQRFPLREPMWRDPDLQDVASDCRKDPKNSSKQLCTPQPYESSFAWDGADNLVFRPMSRFFAVDPGGESINVNSLDETPDSSWFTNRIGVRTMTPAQVALGACPDDAGLDPEAADGAWLIDQGKMNGANPGFRIQYKGVKYMLKSDPADQPERATGATVIATRLYHAAGWFVPCERVVYFRRSLLKLKDGLEVTDNTGVTRAFNDSALDELLRNASRRGDLIRMVASRWLPGRALGPFKYDGVRDDDPNDVVAHEDRRDLRGARLIAAWLNHFDSREQNSMTTWMAADPARPDSSPGHTIHWYMDLGDCFGSEWAWDEISRRLGHAYYLDVPYLVEDFATLGIPRRPWDNAARSPEGKIFGYFHSRDFQPELWRGGYPNPAFGRMTERDGAWAARVLARFTPEHVEAAVRAGDYTRPENHSFLVNQLLLRHKAILARYLTRLSPLADLAFDGDRLCATDLARLRSVAPYDAFRYSARSWSGPSLASQTALAVQPQHDGKVCTTVAHVAPDGSTPDDSPNRYVVIDLANGHALGPARIHAYDLGPRRGFKLVGIERPATAAPPG